MRRNASVAVPGRFLAPDDFGLVAYATLVNGLVELFTGLASGAESSRPAYADRFYYNAAWTMNVAQKAQSPVALIVLVQPAWEFFEESRLVLVILTIAAMPLLQGFENVVVVEFRTVEFDGQLRYRRNRGVLHGGHWCSDSPRRVSRSQIAHQPERLANALSAAPACWHC